MIKKLKKLVLPVDDLLKDYRICGPANKILTLNFVQNKDLQGKAKNYIIKLLENMEQYGYLYYLYDKNLYIPLQVELKGETFMECGYEYRIKKELESQASQFFQCDDIKFRITYVELLYFYIRIMDPTLTWIAVEYKIQSVPYHTHLIMSPDRKYSYREIKT